MDFDGLVNLIKADTEQFAQWRLSSNKRSIVELGEDFIRWWKHYDETYKKYVDLQTDDVLKDSTLQGIKATYFFRVTYFALVALETFTTKLMEEYNRLSSKRKTKTRRNKKVNKITTT